MDTYQKEIGMNLKEVIETAPSWATAIGKTKAGINVWMNDSGYSYFHNPEVFFRYFIDGASISDFNIVHTINSFIERIDKEVAKAKAKEAQQFLQEAMDVMSERGKQYDSQEKERSMGKTIQAFNIITSKDLTESEGWLLLQLLKDVRQWSKEAYHEDSALDCIAYAALKAEALNQGK